MAGPKTAAFLAAERSLTRAYEHSAAINEQGRLATRAFFAAKGLHDAAATALREAIERGDEDLTEAEQAELEGLRARQDAADELIDQNLKPF